jgi:3-mercaptopyruvate sulfurtransferase SseA
MQASFLYFVARYLGYETKMYDGSMAEWTRLPGTPVETGMPE